MFELEGELIPLLHLPLLRMCLMQQMFSHLFWYFFFLKTFKSFSVTHKFRTETMNNIFFFHKNRGKWKTKQKLTFTFVINSLSLKQMLKCIVYPNERARNNNNNNIKKKNKKTLLIRNCH